MAKKKAVPDRARVRREFLALRPAHNPIIGWKEVEGRVVLTVPRPNNWKIRLINRFFEVPPSRTVDLDALGSFVWLRCDGQTSIDKLSRELQREYKIGAREAELSLQQFFEVLGRRGYIGFVTKK